MTFYNVGAPEDVLLAKFDTSGEVVWAVRFGSSSDDFILDVAADDEGNFFLAMNCGNVLHAGDSIISPAGPAILCKISGSGELLQWRTSQISSKLDCVGGDLVGMMTSTATGLTLRRYDPDLQVLWTVDMPQFTVLGDALDVNANGEIAIVCREHIDDLLIIQGVTVPNDPIDQNEAFVALFDPAGNLQWVRSHGNMNAYNERARGVALSNDGSIYVATASDTSFAFAGIVHGHLPGTNAIMGYLLAYDVLGNEQWSIPAHSYFNQTTFWDVIVGLDGNIVTTADLINGGVVAGLSVPNLSRPYTLLKLDPSGNVIWLKHPMSGSTYANMVIFDIGQGSDGAYYAGGFGNYFYADCAHLPGIGYRYYVARVVEEPPVVPEAAFTWWAAGADVEFTDQSLNSTSWSWQFGDGGTSTSQSPIHSYSDQGTYVVSLLVGFGVCADLVTDTITILSTSLPGNEGQDLLAGIRKDENRLAPNPVLDQCTVFAGQAIQRLSLFDATGRELFISQAANGSRQAEIDLRGLTPGQYLLKVHTASGIIVHRLVRI